MHRERFWATRRSVVSSNPWCLDLNYYCQETFLTLKCLLLDELLSPPVQTLHGPQRKSCNQFGNFIVFSLTPSQVWHFCYLDNWWMHFQKITLMVPRGWILKTFPPVNYISIYTCRFGKNCLDIRAHQRLNHYDYAHILTFGLLVCHHGALIWQVHPADLQTRPAKHQQRKRHCEHATISIGI